MNVIFNKKYTDFNTITENDIVKTKYGIGTIVDIKEWSDDGVEYAEYYIETYIGNYKLTRGEIELFV
jgi:hypothetical protein